MLVAGAGRGKLQASFGFQPAQAGQVSIGNRSTLSPELDGSLQLREAERRREVGQVVLETRGGDLVEPVSRGRIALPRVVAYAVKPHRSSTGGKIVVVGDEHPSLAGGDRLCRVEAERAGTTDGPRKAPVT